MNKAEWLKRIDSDEAQIIDLCRKLVQIPSENPPGDTREVVHFLSDLFKGRGLDFQIYAPQETKPNFVARVKGNGEGKRLVLNGHVDTVSAGDLKVWSRDPFSGDVEEGKIFGRAASNMKGGDAASIMAFLYLAENRERLKGEAVLALVSDDETGGEWGIVWSLDHVEEMRGDAVLNGGPSGCRFVNFAEKGPIWMVSTSRGKASLAAYPHLGVNAVHQMIEFLSALRGLEAHPLTSGEFSETLLEGQEVLDDLKGVGTAEALIQITVSVGLISGGRKVNHVPEECRAEVDIRLPPGARASAILSEIASIQSRYLGIRCTYSLAEDPAITPPDHEIVQLTAKHAALTQDQPVFLGCGLGFTSCRYFRSRGIPCAVYGPRPNHIGDPDEFVFIKDLIDTVKVHALTALDYLGYFD
jgi:succinyl-diaminopimelate desuccinylase